MRNYSGILLKYIKNNHFLKFRWYRDIFALCSLHRVFNLDLLKNSEGQILIAKI